MKILLAATCAVMLAATPSFAQPREEGFGGAGPAVSGVLAPMYQFESRLHGGGDVSVRRVYLRIDGNGKVSDSVGAGIGLGYEFDDYRFSGPAFFTGAPPWSEVHRLALHGRFSCRLDPSWTVVAAPSVQVSREDGAGWSDAFGYGGFLAAIRSVRPGFTVGFGGGAFNALEKVRFFPFVFFDWRITDRVRLGNPIRPGPTGPGGLELSFDLGDGWQSAVGAAYRSNRFRLRDDGVVPAGIGEDRAFPVWGRLSYRAGGHATIDLRAGVMLGGELSVEDGEGNRLGSDRYDPAPFAAVSAVAHF